MRSALVPVRDDGELRGRLPGEVLAVVAAEEEGEAVQVGAQGFQAIGGVADEVEH